MNPTYQVRRTPIGTNTVLTVTSVHPSFGTVRTEWVQRKGEDTATFHAVWDEDKGYWDHEDDFGTGVVSVPVLDSLAKKFPLNP